MKKTNLSSKNINQDMQVRMLKLCRLLIVLFSIIGNCEISNGYKMVQTPSNIGPYYTVIDNTGNQSEINYVLRNNGLVVASGYLCPQDILYLGVYSDECTFGPPGGSTATLTMFSGPLNACNSCSAGNNCIVTNNSLDINGTLTIVSGVNYWVITN